MPRVGLQHRASAAEISRLGAAEAEHERAATREVYEEASVLAAHSISYGIESQYHDSIATVVSS